MGGGEGGSSQNGQQQQKEQAIGGGHLDLGFGRVLSSFLSTFDVFSYFDLFL